MSRHPHSRRVCFVVTLASSGGRYGGPLDVVLEQGRIIAERGWTSDIVAGHLTGDALSADAHSPVRSWLVRRWLPMPAFAGLFSSGLLRGLWASIGASDIVHVAFARELVPVVATAIAIVRRKPVVAQPHGMMTSRSSLLHYLFDVVTRSLRRRVDCWIALTPREARELKERFGRTVRRTEVLGNPIPFSAADAEALRSAASSPQVSAVFLARLHPRKRVLDFAAAARIAHERGWPERYRVFGPDQGDLGALRAIEGRTPSLSYEGVVDRKAIPEVLLSNGVFVLTAADEPWGNVLVAATALGVPVVLTRSSALAEALEERDGVFVVADRDPEAVAEAVHLALAHPQLSPETSSFDRGSIGARLTAIYDSCGRGAG